MKEINTTIKIGNDDRAVEYDTDTKTVYMWDTWSGRHLEGSFDAEYIELLKELFNEIEKLKI